MSANVQQRLILRPTASLAGPAYSIPLEHPARPRDVSISILLTFYNHLVQGTFSWIPLPLVYWKRFTHS